jgi:hypothetical protein
MDGYSTIPERNRVGRVGHARHVGRDGRGDADGGVAHAQPIPTALVGRTLGPGLPKPGLMALGIIGHFAYGGVFGGLLATITGRVTVPKGLLLGLALWLVMQVIWLPYLGWGLFGMSVTPKIAVGTLVLHLIYGATLGAVADRDAVTHRGSVSARAGT